MMASCSAPARASERIWGLHRRLAVWCEASEDRDWTPASNEYTLRLGNNSRPADAKILRSTDVKPLVFT
jgi:hypothetical protein